MSLRLHEASHDAVSHEEVVIVRDQCGDNRVVWAFTPLVTRQVQLKDYQRGDGGTSRAFGCPSSNTKQEPRF